MLKLLASFDFNVLVYDPFLDERDASELGVTKVTLDKIFRQADVVSLHTPHLAETERMITGALLRSMKQGATFINTARAAVVCQEQLIEVAAQRPDLQFVLDVVEPEQPAPDSALRTLENVVLTPHIAGSMGNECRRMGRFMVEELERYVAGRPLQGALSMESFWHSSHRPPHAPESFKPIHRVEPGITILTKTRRPLPV